MKILEELWYGNVTPGERSVEKVDRLWNLGKLILQNEEELAPLLSEKAKEVLEKLRDNQSELNDLNECEVFVCGFRLGARIMLEVLVDGINEKAVDTVEDTIIDCTDVLEVFEEYKDELERVMFSETDESAQADHQHGSQRA